MSALGRGAGGSKTSTARPAIVVRLPERAMIECYCPFAAFALELLAQRRALAVALEMSSILSDFSHAAMASAFCPRAM